MDFLELVRSAIQEHRWTPHCCIPTSVKPLLLVEESVPAGDLHEKIICKDRQVSHRVGQRVREKHTQASGAIMPNLKQVRSEAENGGIYDHRSGWVHGLTLAVGAETDCSESVEEARHVSRIVYLSSASPDLSGGGGLV